ncbi:uncharacterized protein LOC103159765 isoform X2 [Cricetulus griseus]|uniref:Uncharacterized protein LOC103159765 isoform X2 n=1 Tax=Cricetulus griseus TaxID=10029 RepID=A0A9J7GN43_CRIGR|nr:uncharacterized protein LOC103159765 isoform X2 [Cricetulus griseus]
MAAAASELRIRVNRVRKASTMISGCVYILEFQGPWLPAFSAEAVGECCPLVLSSVENVFQHVFPVSVERRITGGPRWPRTSRSRPRRHAAQEPDMRKRQHRKKEHSLSTARLLTRSWEWTSTLAVS